jgi:hypothetical protein
MATMTVRHYTNDSAMRIVEMSNMHCQISKQNKLNAFKIFCIT